MCVHNSSFRCGHLKHWVQQNHDGLPQKAGYPQHALNEIHGAWFDPSNPVVPMDGHLREDLNKWLDQEEDTADLVLAMGTSLCGMSADRIVEGAARRRLEDSTGLGAVIVGFQRTRMDGMASLRIFAAIDEVMVSDGRLLRSLSSTLVRSFV
jgi:NAD-dependent SIR2 family protein deacetylase